MCEDSIKRLALVLAIQAEIEGMKATNEDRRVLNEPPVHDEAAFAYQADELRALAAKEKTDV